MTAALIWGFIVHVFTATIWPALVAFGGWIAAVSVTVLAFLFSPAIRKYTIGALAVALILAVTWINGYIVGKSHGANICSDPGFHQSILKGKNDKSAIAAVRDHNDLGEKLGCWSNENIR